VEGEDMQETPKKERPQTRNLKPLGSGVLTPEEELEIRRKGKKAADRARKRNADIRAAVKAVSNMNSKGRGKSLDVLKMTDTAQLNEDGAPLIAQLVHAQFVCALNGDKEARDWICRMLGMDEEQIRKTIEGLTVTADADALEHSGGVRIHLIRGDKPKEDESEEDAATRAANRLAVVEAMKAAGEAADQIGEAVAGKVAEVLSAPDGDSGE
jgi:hypothetical protein